MEEQNPSICDLQLTNSETNTTLNKRGNDLLEVNPNRISDLPEHLLIQILSLLDMKDVVKTCYLCKEWVNLWTNVNNLVYSFEKGIKENPSELRVDKFITFVHDTLMFNTRPNLNEFSFSASYGDFWKDNVIAHNLVDQWLQCIFKKNVEFFKMEIAGLGYKPPEWFYHSSSLVALEISDWEINILGQAVSWPSLKTLFLSNVVIGSHKQIDKILLGCPVIETLLLNDVTGIVFPNIVSKSLIRLIVFQRNHDHDIMAITAPWLRELEIYGTFSVFIPLLWEVRSLITATLDLSCIKLFDNCDFLLAMSRKLLENVCHVEELKLGVLFVQALSIMTKDIGHPPPLFKCKRLTVYLSISKYELFGVARLLQNAPNLETLVIEVENNTGERNFKKYLDEVWDTQLTEYLSMHLEDFPYLKSMEFEHHLRTVEAMVEAQCSNNKVFACEILAYILRNARVKEKLVIKARFRPLFYASMLAHELKSNLEIDGEFEFREKPSCYEFKFCN